MCLDFGGGPDTERYVNFSWTELRLLTPLRYILSNRAGFPFLYLYFKELSFRQGLEIILEIDYTDLERLRFGNFVLFSTHFSPIWYATVFEVLLGIWKVQKAYCLLKNSATLDNRYPASLVKWRTMINSSLCFSLVSIRIPISFKYTKWSYISLAKVQYQGHSKSSRKMPSLRVLILK